MLDTLGGHSREGATESAQSALTLSASRSYIDGASLVAQKTRQ